MKPEAYQINYEFEENHWWFLGRRKILCSVIQDVINKGHLQTKSIRILDYGCGTGGLTQTLDAFGSVTGVDESEEAIRYCRERGLENVEKIQSANDLPNLTFHLVCSFDVLEHFEDDTGLLTELYRTLQPGGILFLTVPAFQCLWSGEDEVSKHVRRYRKRELTQKVHETGFEIVKASYFNFSLFPMVFVIRTFNRMFRPSTLQRSDVTPAKEPLNTLLKNIFSFERFVLRYAGFPLGVSLLVVARKAGGSE